MKRISVNTTSKYDVLVGNSFLGDVGSFALEQFAPCKICIVTDTTVRCLYGDLVSNSLTKAGFECFFFSFLPGEASKSLDTYGKCLEFLAGEKFTRADGILCLGGGIPGDLGGFVASTYLRGIKFIQIPTTLLAAVDSSVGGKTGINLSPGKNLAGAFWQPCLVVCDVDTFKTLAHETFLDGVAEAIKYGIILDEKLFAQLYAIAPMTSSFENLEEIVATCIEIKSRIVTADERDTGIRQLLNLGHTIGHAIEKCSGYSISHGHAVATGIAILSRASQQMGYTDVQTLLLIESILEKHGFQLTSSFSIEELLPVLLNDKKRGGSSINLIIPSKIGCSEIMEFPVNTLDGFLKAGLK